MTAPILDVRYVARALSSADADLAFFTAEVAWDDRMQARRTASFGVPYNYSGQEYEACEMPASVASMAMRASELAGHSFNNCLCNLYESGENRMGFHRDSYDGLVPGSLIAIASFGATRSLVFRSADEQHRVELPLEHGSILLMSEATQREWMHALPRTVAVGMRVSATFRLFV